MKNFKARLLRETAEIALSEVKHFLEPRLMDRFQLRRVSAPLILPVDSPLLTTYHPGVRVTLPGCGYKVEIVGSLDTWLRGQLARYDIAPAFGVFTIMNAIRPELPENNVSSAHIAAWAWQQVADDDTFTHKHLLAQARTLYQLFVETEKMLLEKFPHLCRTLPDEAEVVSTDLLADKFKAEGHQRMLHQLLHPKSSQRPVDPRIDYTEASRRAIILLDGNLTEIWVWNNILGRPERIAEMMLTEADNVGPKSIGGNIYRDQLALQILHQTHLLV